MVRRLASRTVPRGRRRRGKRSGVRVAAPSVGRVEAFGYGPAVEFVRAIGVQVCEAKDSATLEPLVGVQLRLAPDAPRVAFAMSPDLADSVADELHRLAARACERHWE
jgi:hypothetical protein